MVKQFLMSLMLMLICGIAAGACQNIVVLGDSLSAARGIDPAKGWVSLLQKRIEKTNPQYCVVNASVGGDTTQEGLSKLPTIIKDHQPEIVIVELGGNDGLRGLPLEVIEKNLSEIVSTLEQRKIRIILVGVRLPPNYGPEYTEQFQKIFARLAKKYSCALVPQLLKGVADYSYLMQADGIHPQAKGQPIMLENVWTVLAEQLDL